MGKFAQYAESVQVELESSERRYLAVAAITARIFSALVIWTVMVALFVEVLLQIDLKWLVGIVFTGSTFALVVNLTYFLREVRLAMQTARIRVSGNR